MKNTLSFLKRKLKNFSTLNKVGHVKLNKTLTELSEVQQQKQNLSEQLDKTNEAISQSALYSKDPGGELVPELMGNQSLYVGTLVQEQQQQQDRLDSLEKDVEQQLKAVFKQKKTNEVVEHKIQLAQQQLGELYFKQMDQEVAELQKKSTGGPD